MLAAFLYSWIRNKISNQNLIILSERIIESLGNSEPAKDKQESKECLRYNNDL